MKPNLPQEPDAKLIESMCMRYDHSHAMRGMIKRDGKFELETPEEHHRRQEANRRVMRQLYEEVSGYGFYNYPTDENE